MPGHFKQKSTGGKKEHTLDILQRMAQEHRRVPYQVIFVSYTMFHTSGTCDAGPFAGSNSCEVWHLQHCMLSQGLLTESLREGIAVTQTQIFAGLHFDFEEMRNMCGVKE